MLSGIQDVKHSDCMRRDVKHSERILAVGQWTGKDGVPNVVRREGTQRVTELCVIVGVGYLHDDDVQGWDSHVSLSLSLEMSVPALGKVMFSASGDWVTDQRFGRQPDSYSCQRFISRNMSCAYTRFCPRNDDGGDSDLTSNDQLSDVYILHGRACDLSYSPYERTPSSP